MAIATKKTEGVAVIAPANIVQSTLRIRGTAPLVQAKFSRKAKELMKAAMSTAKADRKSKKDRPPRDFEVDFRGAMHRTTTGKYGIPCAAFRAAMIDACRTCGLVMTQAKMAVWVVPDGIDAEDGTPLTFLQSKAEPERHESMVRNDNGSADIRVRPMWREWFADVTVEFDADMISEASVVNLLDRAGRQVGVGEGRPFSKDSCGQGWGTFIVVEATKEGGKNGK